MIRQCICKHDYQDQLYGKGNRVHTTSQKTGAVSNWKLKCTVCGLKK